MPSPSQKALLAQWHEDRIALVNWVASTMRTTLDDPTDVLDPEGDHDVSVAEASVAVVDALIRSPEVLARLEAMTA